MRRFSWIVPLALSCLILLLGQVSRAASVSQLGDDELGHTTNGGDGLGAWIHGSFVQRHVQVPFKGWFDAVSALWPGSSERDFWEEAAKLQGQYKEYVSRLGKEVKAKYNDVSRSFDDVRQQVQDVVDASTDLRNKIASGARAQDFSLENFSEELGKQLERVLEELKEEFPPTDQAPGHAERREIAEKAVGKVESRMAAVAIKLGVEETDIHKFFTVAGPHIVDVVTTTGDIIRQHPVLVTAILSTVVGLIIPESLILRPIFGLFGFGPSGPVKGTAAAGIQRWLYGASVPAGSWFSISQRIGMVGTAGWKWLGGLIGATVGLGSSLCLWGR